MRRVTVDPGKAKAGQVVLDANGEYVEVCDVIGAHELIAGLSEQHRTDRPSVNFFRDSMAARCVMFGVSTGRQKRDRERLKAKLAKQAKKVSEGV
jgi:hypothetical protein